MARLKIKEIFYSLQGETSLTGLPTLFVRLSGCPLRCTYCDSEYAFTGGDWYDVDQLVEQVIAQSSGVVCVTGGEPLAQPDCLVLLTKLVDLGLKVSLETSGAIDVAAVDPRVIKIIDLKTPGSAESHRNIWQNLDYLQPHDEVKFVLMDRQDYDWARLKCESVPALAQASILFSPVYGQLEPQRLADWILQDRCNVRMQIQLHKLLWGDLPGK